MFTQSPYCISAPSGTLTRSIALLLSAIVMIVAMALPSAAGATSGDDQAASAPSAREAGGSVGSCTS